MPAPAAPNASGRSTARFKLVGGSAILLLIGIVGPWQRTLFGISADGLEVAPVQLVAATLLAGYALYLYDGGQESHRKRVGRLLITTAVLVGLAIAGNAEHIGGIVLAGWGPVVAGVGGAGMFMTGVAVLRSPVLAA
jgi:hypothetical protein